MACVLVPFLIYRFNSFLSYLTNFGVRFVLLPDDLCHEIIANFLSLIELVKLDSVFCNSKQREWFLRILRSFVLDTDYMTSLREWQWISLRSVRVNRLCLSPHCFDTSESLIVTACCSAICELQLFGLKVNESILLSFINQCPKLISLWIDDTDSFTDHVALNLSGLILKQLQVFIVDNEKVDTNKCSKELTCAFVSHFAKFCSGLVDLKLTLSSDNDCKRANDALTALIETNTGLIKVLLNFENVEIAATIIDTIDKYCPQIQSVDLKHCAAISFSRVSEFVIKRQEQLRLISVTDKFNRYFTYSKIAGNRKYNTKKLKVLLIHHLDVGNSQNLVEFFTKVTRFERVYFTCMTWLINADVIAALAKFSPDLSALVLRQSGGYDISMFTVLFLCCQKLDKLILSHYNHVSNAQLVEIFSVPNNVTALDISNHTSLSNDTLLTILATNPQIRTLRCESVDSVDLTALQLAIATQGFRHVTLTAEPIMEIVYINLR